MKMVSIILNTKNEEKNIGNALQSIAGQTFNKDLMEVIVVDNGSVDKTKEIAKKFGVQVFNKGPERSSQKNFGAGRASGNYLFFMDADMILSPGVIGEAVEKFEGDRDLAGLYIDERILGKGYWSKVRNFERQFYNMTPIDAVRFLRREDFLASGGFDERLYACEDWDLHKRVIGKRKMDILKSVVYHNEQEMNLKKLLSKKKYYAASFKKYIDKWGKNDPELKKQFGFGYRYFRVFFENGKWQRLLRHPLLFVGMFFSKILVGVVYLISIISKKQVSISK